MRVLVATDRIGTLSSANAGAVLASAWSGADVTVVPVGEAGAGFAQAAADQQAVELVTGALGERLVSVAAGATTVVSVEASGDLGIDSIPLAASSAVLGLAVEQQLGARRRTISRLVIDLGGVHVHDGGAGFLAVLGATGDAPLDRGVLPLGGLTQVNIGPVRALLAGIELVGVVPTNEITQPLLGLRGITSLRGGAGVPHSDGRDRAALLTVDDALSRFARLVSPDRPDRPGAGAGGGTALAVLALGGRLVTGPRFAFESDSAARAVSAGTDLVVTGCTSFDVASRGGGVVAEAARVATDALCPCIAVSGDVLIGNRELRTMGIEAAYAARELAHVSSGAHDMGAAELLVAARRVARSWQW